MMTIPIHSESFLHMAVEQRGVGKFNIHYEVGRMHEESTHGFILPEKLKLTLDIEDKQAQNHFKEAKVLPFNPISKHNKIAEVDMDYTTRETLESSLSSLVEELRNWDRQHREVINEAIAEMRSKK